MISDQKRLEIESKIDYVLRDMIEHKKSSKNLTEAKVNYSNLSVYKFFVEPFKDVFKAVRLSVLDIGNVFRFLLTGIIANMVNSKKLMLEAHISFNERRQEINKEWQPILDRAKEAIGGTDPIFRMALLGPQAFFTIKGLDVALLAGKTAAEALTGTGWDRLVNNFSSNLSTAETLNKLKERERKDKLEKREVHREIIEKLSSLERLFFGKALTFSQQNPQAARESFENISGVVIVEKKEEQKTSPEEAVTIWANATGLTDAQYETAVKFSKSIYVFETIRKSALVTASYSAKLVTAKNLKEFEEILKEIKNKGGNVDLSKISQIEDFYNSKLKEIVQQKKNEIQQQINSKKDKQAPKNTPVQTQQNISKSDKKNVSQPQVSSIAGSGEQKIDEKEIQAASESALWTKMKEAFADSIIKNLEAVDDKGKSIFEPSIKLDDTDLSLMKKHKNVDVRNAAKIYEENQEAYKDLKNSVKNLKQAPTKE